MSLVIFIALDVDASEHIGRLGELFPGMEQMPFAQQLTTILTVLTGAAIAEEIMFRGLLLGLMLRISGGATAGVIGSVVLCSALWAVLHLLNTDALLVKFGQIFIVGLVLSEFARRACVEAAIAGHVGLNLLSVLLSLFVEL